MKVSFRIRGFSTLCVRYALPRSVAQGFSANPHMLTEEEEGEGRNHGRVVQIRLQKTTFLSSDSGFKTPFIGPLLNADQILFRFSDKELKSFNVEKCLDYPLISVADPDPDPYPAPDPSIKQKK